MNAKLGPLHSWFGDLGLVLGYDTGAFEHTAALRTLFRQRYFHHFIDRRGNGPPTVLTVALASLPAWGIGVGFGLSPGKGSRLPLRWASSKSFRSRSISARNSSFTRRSCAICSW